MSYIPSDGIERKTLIMGGEGRRRASVETENGFRDGILEPFIPEEPCVLIENAAWL
jgi:hypothetical protein